MHALRLAGLLMLLGLATGCPPKKAPPPPPGPPPAPPADVQTLQQLREAYAKSHPQMLVGLVDAVLAEDRLASVSELPVAQFRTGDVVTFVDSKFEPLVSGRVLTIVGNRLHVRFDPPSAKARAPKVGDLAVRLK